MRIQNDSPKWFVTVDITTLSSSFFPFNFSILFPSQESDKNLGSRDLQNTPCSLPIVTLTHFL